MRLFVLTFAVVATLNISPAEGQQPVKGAAHFPALEAYTLPAGLQIGSGGQYEYHILDDRMKRYVFWGVVAGAAAGVVWGVVGMATTEDYVGPPPFVLTVPVGMLAGAAVGAVMARVTN